MYFFCRISHIMAMCMQHLRDGCGGFHGGLHGDDEKHTCEFYKPF